MKLSLTPAFWLAAFSFYFLFCSALLVVLGVWVVVSPLTSAFMFAVAAALCACFADRKGPLTSTVPEFLLIFALSVIVLFLQEIQFGQAELSGIDALFQSVALMTTTHAEILSGLDHLGYELHLLRAGAQIFGALWIIHFTVVAAPTSLLIVAQPRAHRHRLQAQRLTGHLKSASRDINIVFASLLVLSTGAYILSGASLLDSIALAGATVSLGGFLPYDASISALGGEVQMVAIVVMILAACNYARYLQCIRSRHFRPFVNSREIRVFILLLVVLVIVILATLYSDLASYYAVRRVIFTIVSVSTTTGLSAEDHMMWGPVVILVFFAALVGGCSGSPAGGFRVSRVIGVYSLFLRQFRWDRQALGTGAFRMPQESIELLPLLLVFWLLAAGVGTWVLTFSGLDAITAMSGAIACLTNTGPGLGPVIGPAGNYAGLPDFAKWVLIFLMLVGRLEFGVALVFLTRSYWSVRTLTPLGVATHSEERS